MIRPLRRAHRWIATGLGVAVPLAYGAILLSRPEVMPTPIGTSAKLPVISAAPGLRGQLASGPDGTWTAALEMDEAVPDLLVYWSPRKRAAPSADAVLLGALSPQARSFALPGSDASGYLLIYSVAYGATQAVFPVASLERAR